MAEPFAPPGTSPEAQLEAVKRELAEAQATLQALRRGEADAILVDTAAGPKVFTLRSADEPYRVFVENLKEGALTVTSDGDVLYSNDAFARMVGQTTADLVGASLAAFADAHAVSDLTAPAGAAGHELRLRRPGDGVLDVQISSTPYRHDGRTVWCLLVTDLTGQSLRLRHNAIVEATDEAVLSFDLDGRITSWNGGAERLFGYTPTEAIGHKGDLLAFQTELTRARETEGAFMAPLAGASSRGELRCLAKDGALIDASVTASPIRDPEGGVIGMCAIIRDIREQKRSEARLRESEERFRASFANASTGFAMNDPEGRYLDANPAFCAIAGYSLEELRGLGFWGLVHPDDRPANTALVERMLAGDIPDFVIENRYVRKDGDIIWVRKSVSLIRSPDRSPRWIVALVEDITARVLAEEALREADRRKDEFLAMLGHELRNPLAPIKNGLEILNSRVDAAKAERVRGMMSRQVDHLVRLVDDLLEISRVSRGKIELRKERIDLARIVGDAVAATQPLMTAFGHRLSVSLPSGPAPLHGDPTRLVQVLVNLLTNAAKFTHPGGSIEISARRESGEAVVSVHDNGVGIPAADLPRVFDLFAQIPNGPDGSRGGLGIGLALVRSLVDMHGGRAEARSDGLGKGSEFVVRLPLSDAIAGRSSEAPEAGAAAQASTHRVLVVDDNPDVADSLGMLLESLGASVRVAYGGSSALEIVGAFKPELVFLDLGMPGMDGYETARRLRRLPDGRGVPLVALTGWGQAADRSRAREAGFDKHFAKPVDIVLLEQILETVRTKGRLSEETGPWRPGH